MFKRFYTYFWVKFYVLPSRFWAQIWKDLKNRTFYEWVLRIFCQQFEEAYTKFDFLDNVYQKSAWCVQNIRIDQTKKIAKKWFWIKISSKISMLLLYNFSLSEWKEVQSCKRTFSYVLFLWARWSRRWY